MNRTLFAAAAVLLLSTGLGAANDLVPGSDTSIRSQQSAADGSVAGSAVHTREHLEFVYNYQAPRAASGSAAEATGALVPGSDSAQRDRQSVADGSVIGASAQTGGAVYGYPSSRTADRSVTGRAASSNGVLVPGSDSF